MEGGNTVTVKGSATFKIKQEKADDCEVATTVQTQAPVVSAQGNLGNIVFSFRTSDNDSVIVIKSEPNEDFGEETTTDKNREEVANMLNEGTAIMLGEERLKGNLDKETAIVNLGEEETATVNLGEKETATVNLNKTTRTDKLSKETTKYKFSDEKAADKIFDKETATKMFDIETATKMSVIQTAGLPEATDGAGGGGILKSLTIEERHHRKRPHSQNNSLSLEEVGRVQDGGAKGNKVAILRLPKHKVEEVWSSCKAATGGPNKKSKLHIEYPNKIHELKRLSTVMQHMVNYSMEATKSAVPPVTVTAQMYSHSSKDNSPETLTSSKSKPSCNILKCLFCGRKFAQMVRFILHMKIHLEKKPIVCGTCDADFYVESAFVEHIQKSHNVHKKEIVYLCSECKIRFRENELSAHLRQHETSQKFLCGICGDGLISCHHALLEHVKQHEIENRMPVKCGVCSKLHLKFAELKSHLKKHFEEGQYMCQMCDKKCKTAVEFSEHYKFHSGLLPFQCKACQMGMRNRHEVHLHRICCPKRQKEHRCRHCLQLFETERDLTRHYQTKHLEHHRCQHCSELFTRKRDLTVHYTEVHSSNTCLFCAETFSTKEQLRAHSKTHQIVANFI